MDFNILYSFVSNKTFTDVEIVLIDEINRVNMNVHKAVLASSSQYFLNLFTKFSETNKSTITIRVRDSQISSDIICSFYGQIVDSTNYPDWKYTLLKYQCLDYFSLDYNIDILTGLKIPSEGFDLLLETANTIGYRNEINKLIAKNIPDNYDLSIFSDEFLGSLRKYICKHNIITANFKSINIYDVITGNKLSSLSLNNNFSHVCKVGKNIIAIVYYCADKIFLFDLVSRDVIDTLHNLDIQSSCDMTAICYIKSLNHLVTANSNNQLIVWDLTTRQIIKIKKVNRLINRLIANHTIITDYNLFISIGYNESILVWDKNYTISKGIDSPNKITTYSASGRELILANARYIKIFDIDEGKILYKTNNDTFRTPYDIINICDNSYILFDSDNEPICYLIYDWKNVSKIRLNRSKKNYDNIFCKKFPPESVNYSANDTNSNILIVVTDYHTVYAQINGKKYGPFVVKPNNIAGVFFVKDKKATNLLNSINEIGRAHV